MANSPKFKQFRNIYSGNSTGLRLQYRLKGHTDVVRSIAWSPDGKWLASNAYDNTTRLWDPITGALLHTLRSHSDAARSIAWSPDSTMLATGAYNNRTKLWNPVVQLWNPTTGTLLHTLEGHIHTINSITWSPNNTMLAAASDQTIRLWDPTTGTLLHALEGHLKEVWPIAWSPDGKLLATGARDRMVRLWDPTTGTLLHTLEGHSDEVWSVVWSPDGKLLATGAYDTKVWVWDPTTGTLLHTLEGHSDTIWSMAWSPHGRLLAAGSRGRTVQLWNLSTNTLLHTLEGHTYEIDSVSWSPDGTLFASSSSLSSQIRIWRSDTWEPILELREAKCLSWHPQLPLLAIAGHQYEEIYTCQLNREFLLQAAPLSETVHYTNAKVVLVGDSGVGKSGLGLVLSGQQFTATESTHGRRVWTFERLAEVTLTNGRKETRETLLWDLAGQPGYRLIHQLHLNEVTVALIVFDAHSETDPFAGVEHWCRALAQAQHLPGSPVLPLKKFLVQARCDRGSVSASPQRIQAIIDTFGLDGYFTTSAKEGWNIVELQAAIRACIDWDTLPKVTSTKLFQQIKHFLIAEKESKRCISTEDDLYSTFLKLEDAPTKAAELSAQFETCIGRVESTGLIRRLSFGKLVLLQPELLDAYAYALVNSIKDEPDGLGSIAEERVRRGDFHMPMSERIEDEEQEKLLLIAMIEDLLRSELALREEQFLVFPSQSTREHPDLTNPEGQSTVFTFEGPVQNIYATLAVRLSYSGLFKKKDLWKNAITYTATVGGTCGLFLHHIGQGSGELTLFFDQKASEETRFNFEQFVLAHLQRHIVQEHLKSRRLFICDDCHIVLTDAIVQGRKARGFNWLNCPVCENRINLIASNDQLLVEPTAPIIEMHYAADSQRDREVLKSTIEGKQAIKDFDVFLCHHSVDKPAIREISKQLKGQGLLPWLDEEQLQPGLPWQRLLEAQIEQIKAAAVFVGKDGIGPWQHQELDAFLREFVDRHCPVIPVLLADATQEPKLPVFLKAMTWVDFRVQNPNPMQRLFWGITSRREVNERPRTDGQWP